MKRKSKTDWVRIARDAFAALNKIEATERDERNKSLVGTCLRYHNSCGSGEDWWLYAKIIRTEDGNLILHKFEVTSRGEIKVDSAYTDYCKFWDGWQTISEDELTTKWQETQARISALSP